MPASDEVIREIVPSLQVHHPAHMSSSKICDELGELDRLKKAIEERTKELKDTLKNRNGDYFEGNYYAVVISDDMRVSLDRNAVESVMGEDWVYEHSRVTYFKKALIRRLPTELPSMA